jgi:probable phosphoglycerate mutase
MIYLLRHGQIEGEGRRRFIGWTDPSLSEEGRETARRWRRSLSSVPFETIVCSDLKRCRETAEIIAAGRPVSAMADLREIHLGEWEGTARETIRTHQPGAWRRRGEDLAHFRPPGGESFADLSDRVFPLFQRIAGHHGGEGDHALVVTHAGAIRVILCRLLGIDLDHMFRIGQAYGGLTLIRQRMGELQVKAMNIPVAY